MTRVAEHLLGARQLNHVSEIHNADPVRNVSYNGEVVRDEHIREVFLFLQLLKKVDYLRLNGNVKRRYTFVANDEFRLDGKRTRNGYSLSLTAGKLMRISVQHIVLQAATTHRFKDIFLHFRRAVLIIIMRHKPFFDNLADRHSRVERGIRVLEYNLKVLAEQAHFRIFQSCKVYAVIEHILIHHKFGVVRIHRFERVYRLADAGYFIFAICNVALENINLFSERRDFFGGFCLLFRIFLRFEKFNLVFYIGNCGVQLDYSAFLAVTLKQERRAFLCALCHKSAEDFRNVRECGFIFGYGKVFLLNVEKRSVCAELVTFFRQRVRFCMGGMNSGNILFRMNERVPDVGGSDFGKSVTVKHGGARRLLIKLKNNSSER